MRTRVERPFFPSSSGTVSQITCPPYSTRFVLASVDMLLAIVSATVSGEVVSMAMSVRSQSTP